MPNPKTNAQLGRIFGLAKTLNASKEDLTEMVGKGLSQLTFDEANALIERLGGEPLPVPTALPQNSNGGARSLRSQQKDRQKAGVKQIVTKAQITRMTMLWFFPKAGRTEAGLTALIQRVIKRDRPATTEDANKVIEAIKQMNRRPARKEAA